MAATRFPTPKNGIFLADWERKRERELWIEKLKSFGFLTRSWQFSNKNNNIFAFSNRDLLTQRVHVYPRIFFLPPQKFPSISTSLFARCNTYPDRFRLSSILFLFYTSHKLAEYIIYEKFPTLSNIIALPIHSFFSEFQPKSNSIDRVFPRINVEFNIEHGGLIFHQAGPRPLIITTRLTSFRGDA